MEWWSTRTNLLKRKAIQPQQPDIVIGTDASMLGWGTVCSGVRTGGLWSQTERKNYIHFPELLSVAFAMKAFAKDTQTTALLYST